MTSLQQRMAQWRTLVFDCDGVLLDSNRIKTDAFYQTALPYGEAAASALRDYHISRGGISRYAKFEFFLKHIIGQSALEHHDLQHLLEQYSAQVRIKLLQCDIADGLAELRQATAGAKWLVVSGSDQAELRDILRVRGLSGWFDGGIFGSPDTKDIILKRELNQNHIQHPAVFFGDSAYDQQAALAAGLEFVFVSEWSEAVGTFQIVGGQILRLSSMLEG